MPQMTPPIAPPIKPTHGETPSFMGFDKIRNRIAAAESNVSTAGDSSAHKKSRHLNFTGGNSRDGSASGNKFFPQNGHHIAE